jgi:hypothetical protein
MKKRGAGSGQRVAPEGRETRDERREAQKRAPSAHALENDQIDALAAGPGVTRIHAERIRQIAYHQWTLDHDREEHDHGELALAACCYAASATSEKIYTKREYSAGTTFTDPWPWECGHDARPYQDHFLKKPTKKQALRLLEKAGALIAAEIDRLLGEEPTL